MLDPPRSRLRAEPRAFQPPRKGIPVGSPRDRVDSCGAIHGVPVTSPLKPCPLSSAGERLLHQVTLLVIDVAPDRFARRLRDASHGEEKRTRRVSSEARKAGRGVSIASHTVSSSARKMSGVDSYDTPIVMIRLLTPFVSHLLFHTGERLIFSSCRTWDVHIAEVQRRTTKGLSEGGSGIAVRNANTSSRSIRHTVCRST